MHNIINLTTHRKMRALQKQCDAIFQGSGPRLIQRGRAPGKTMSVDDILALIDEGRGAPHVPVDSARREMEEETGVSLDTLLWVSVRGRAADMIKQLPTAKIIPFKTRTTND